MAEKDFLYPHQKEALTKMFNGCILNGGTGSGKSRTGIYYYFQRNGGSIKNKKYNRMKNNPPDLYILTTAKKKHDMEWEEELVPFLLYPDRKTKLTEYGNKIIVDSWQCIKKYENIKNAQFIFDENKINGKGAWAKSFLKITKNNEWIILSATNGDKWQDYETLFLAHGFFRSRREFREEHLIFSPYNNKYPEIIGYRDERRLVRLRDRLLIDMDFDRHTTQIHEDIFCSYDTSKYRDAMRTRTNPYKQGYVPCFENDKNALLVGFDIDITEVTPIMEGWEYEPINGDFVKLINEPIQQAAGLCYVLRRIVNSDESRQVALLELLESHPKSIIFYNFNYELDILLNLAYQEGTIIAQYNGHQHDALPVGDKWIYLVQYTSGCEAWNTVSTDTIIFYSQNYSYKVLVQASGRIDRLTTPYTELHYYHLKSRSGIDLAISKALREKKKFNERKFTKWNN